MTFELSGVKAGNQAMFDGVPVVFVETTLVPGVASFTDLWVEFQETGVIDPKDWTKSKCALKLSAPILGAAAPC